VKNVGFREDLFRDMQEEMLKLIGDRVSIRFGFSDLTEKTPMGKAKVVEQKLNIWEYLPR